MSKIFYFSAFRVQVRVSDGRFSVNGPAFPAGWFHIVVNFHGAEAGFSLYVDGSHVGTHTAKQPQTNLVLSKEIGIGRLYLNTDDYYSTVEVDELMIWNRNLSAQDVLDIFNLY